MCVCVGGGGGRSLWGTATVSCVSLQPKTMQVLWGEGGRIEAGGGGGIPGPPLHTKKYNKQEQ